jgi:hypothetical protein
MPASQLYFVENKFYKSTIEFQNYFNNKYNNYELIISFDKGIQQIPINFNYEYVTAEDCNYTHYIGGGGYCMFYSLFAIIYIINQTKRKRIKGGVKGLYQSLTTPGQMYEIFPKYAANNKSHNGSAHNKNQHLV